MLSQIHAATISNIILTMQEDYDNGLREFQESIHHCIFIIALMDDASPETKNHLQKVNDLANRLRKLEVCYEAIPPSERPAYQ